MDQSRSFSDYATATAAARKLAAAGIEASIRRELNGWAVRAAQFPFEILESLGTVAEQFPIDTRIDEAADNAILKVYEKRLEDKDAEILALRTTVERLRIQVTELENMNASLSSLRIENSHSKSRISTLESRVLKLSEEAYEAQIQIKRLESLRVELREIKSVYEAKFGPIRMETRTEWVDGGYKTCNSCGGDGGVNGGCGSCGGTGWSEERSAVQKRVWVVDELNRKGGASLTSSPGAGKLDQ